MRPFRLFQGHELQKTVFVVFFHGEQIKLRVKKVCHGFQATLYPCPPTYKEQQDMLAGVGSRIKDLEMVWFWCYYLSSTCFYLVTTACDCFLLSFCAGVVLVLLSQSFLLYAVVSGITVPLRGKQVVDKSNLHWKEENLDLFSHRKILPKN